LAYVKLYRSSKRMTKKTLLYKDAGVDIETGERFVRLITPLVQRTFTSGVRGDIGGFAALFAPDVSAYRRPLLVAATDGVGTKLRVASLAGRYDTIGIDLVAMCVNDVVVTGATPLFFLDYLATAHLDLERGVEIMQGISQGCLEAGCALVGGETAEMPGFYREGDFELAGGGRRIRSSTALPSVLGMRSSVSPLGGCTATAIPWPDGSLWRSYNWALMIRPPA
jgi:phosphoribosylformylglycinamidine cyclo-ligase